uniref:LBH domain-containing protein n=1 Tax=Myripristis murdjan TaxID=586833 RepID=A0A668A3Z0_9TELE
MTEVMNTCDSTVGGATADGGLPFQICADRPPRLPSIVVEPSDGGEVESGELRWPPDDLGCPGNDPREDETRAACSAAPAEEAEPADHVMGGVSN